MAVQPFRFKTGEQVVSRLPNPGGKHQIGEVLAKVRKKKIWPRCARGDLPYYLVRWDPISIAQRDHIQKSGHFPSIAPVPESDLWTVEEYHERERKRKAFDKAIEKTFALEVAPPDTRYTPYFYKTRPRRWGVEDNKEGGKSQ